MSSSQPVRSNTPDLSTFSWFHSSLLANATGCPGWWGIVSPKW